MIDKKNKIIIEKISPGLKNQIKIITQYIGEREREPYCRLKKFKSSE